MSSPRAAAPLPASLLLALQSAGWSAKTRARHTHSEGRPRGRFVVLSGPGMRSIPRPQPPLVSISCFLDESGDPVGPVSFHCHYRGTIEVFPSLTAIIELIGIEAPTKGQA